jgi:hypothetical protein
MNLSQLRPQTVPLVDEEGVLRGSESQASGHRRPRSASIAILRDTRTSVAVVPDDDVDRTYDWATWRMYNRIVEYRFKHSITYPTTDTPWTSQGTQKEAAIIDEDDSFFLPVRKSVEPEHRQEAVPVPDDEMPGEIFDFEL